MQKIIEFFFLSGKFRLGMMVNRVIGIYDFLLRIIQIEVYVLEES
jgi:hypothetical protein